jgi:hypothetical protein
MFSDPEGQASLMLCESILHLLVEERVITKGRALEAINGVLELLQESEQIGQRRSTRCSAVQLIEAIARTFALKGSDEGASKRASMAHSYPDELVRRRRKLAV